MLFRNNFTVIKYVSILTESQAKGFIIIIIIGTYYIQRHPKVEFMYLLNFQNSRKKKI